MFKLLIFSSKVTTKCSLEEKSKYCCILGICNTHTVLFQFTLTEPELSSVADTEPKNLHNL